jgi:hypothetical protein
MIDVVLRSYSGHFVVVVVVVVVDVPILRLSRPGDGGQKTCFLSSFYPMMEAKSSFRCVVSIYFISESTDKVQKYSIPQ